MFSDSRPLIGVPFRALREEDDASMRAKIEPYLRAIEAAGGHPAEISLRLPPEKLVAWAAAFDAILLPGSPADVDPASYKVERHPKCHAPDRDRESTDYALLKAAFAANKPVLAICYGVQSLNVYLGGSLVQDISAVLQSDLPHQWSSRSNDAPEPHHDVAIESGSRLATLAGTLQARVNSSHHQALDRLGRGLRVAARAPDGVIEAVEFSGDAAVPLANGIPWVLGVQWHPERMPSDALAQSLFHELISAARKQVVGTR